MWGSADGRSGAKGAGPVAEATDNVSCLSCHRAHASGFESMLRFAHANEFTTIADAAGLAMFDTNTVEGKINRGFSGKVAQETQYYGRLATEFAPYQRLLCNKCHAKD
jgi:predicted CXXCH cytochrome family protein